MNFLVKHDPSLGPGLTFVGAGRFRDNRCFGRWDQCVEHPRLFRIVTRDRSDRRTTVEWTVDGRLQPSLVAALALIGDGPVRG